MNFLSWLLFVGATLAAGHGLANDETEIANFQNGDRFFVKPYPLFVNTFALDPEALMTTVQLIQHRGYPVEIQTVTTEDGYILTMHRIPHGKNISSNPTLLPVLLIHGTFGFADHFLVNTPENAVAYLLADAGFDVWCANLRGTEHSHLHKSLSTRDPKYWQFSIDEIAKFDIPAFIDKMLSVTGKSQVFLSGHSLGGGLPIVMLAERPELNIKVKAVFALAPFGNLEKFSPIAKIPSVLFPLIKLITDLMGIYELPKFPPVIQGYLGKDFEFGLRMLTFILAGPSGFGQWDSKRLQINAAHLPSTMGLYIVYHLLQLISKNGLRKFDWGTATNIQKYNQTTPPDYDLSKVTVPCYLYYGKNDWFCTKENVQFLEEHLPNSTMKEAGNGWNHIDFIWGKHAGQGFYNCMVDLMKRT